MSENEIFSAIEVEVRDNSHSTPFSKVSAIMRALSRLFTGGLRVDEEQAIRIAGGVWASVVVPYDIPYVPELLERQVEMVAWSACEKMIRSLVRSFNDIDKAAG